MRHQWTVRGTGPFPIDMLRYDHAYPSTEEDAGTIERSHRPRERSHRPRERGPHTVQVTADVGPGVRLPTTPRWESFGWKVVA